MTECAKTMKAMVLEKQGEKLTIKLRGLSGGDAAGAVAKPRHIYLTVKKVQ